ncbi:MAG: hypothetical protein ACXU7X_12240 [Croceibacterium sp.]
MWTERTVLKIGKADGTVAEVPMRYNASHLRGYRCFVGSLADAPDEIVEGTPRSFEGRRLFDALAEYRAQIEPDGWRLLHAAARRDCWAKPDDLNPVVQQLSPGTEVTKPRNAFEPADFGEVCSLAEQRDNFDRWMKSLSPVYAPRAPRKAGHEHDPPAVEFSSLARSPASTW